MKRTRVLYVSSELAPLCGDGPRGEFARALTSALTTWRVDVTVVAPVEPGRDPERWGLAKRLNPLQVTTRDGVALLPYYEGRLPNGGVDVVLVDCGNRRGGELLTSIARTVATERDQPFHVLHVVDDTAAAAEVARQLPVPAGAEPVATVVSLLDDGAVSPALASALAAADRIALASPTYARELLDSAATDAATPLARALAPLAERVRGIAHGIDDARWSPARDGYAPVQFSIDDPSRKAECKLELQRSLGLPPRPRTPMYAARGPFRLLTAEHADAIAAADIQIVFLLDPARDAAAAPMLRDLARNSTRVATCAINDPGEREMMAHRLIAGADFDLVTDTFRPGGHSSLYFMAYGNVPVAPRCGGYADVMVDFDRISGTGNAFLYGSDGDGLVSAVFRAARSFRNAHPGLVLRTMEQDLSWRSAARRYAELYRDAIKAAAGGQKLDTPSVA